MKEQFGIDKVTRLMSGILFGLRTPSRFVTSKVFFSFAQARRLYLYSLASALWYRRDVLGTSTLQNPSDNHGFL